MKTEAELNALKNEVEAINKKLAELSEEELAEVFGGEQHGYVHIPRIYKIPDLDSDGNTPADQPQSIVLSHGGFKIV